MSNIDLQSILFRKTDQSQNSNEPIHDSAEFCPKAESVCQFEADCMASHIINRLRIGKGDGIENPGLEEVWNQELERRKQLNISLASKSLSQGRLNSETESHYKFEQMYLIKSTNLINKPVDVLNIPKVVNEVYPAESQEGSLLFKAVDVSVHHPSNAFNCSNSITTDETVVELTDTTIVDETTALNNSIHYSQISLNNDDMDLLDMLKDLEDNSIEEDSVMSTPEIENEIETKSDDEDYSQIFHEETVILDHDVSDNNDRKSQDWNDTFWEGAKMPQLDGTCDDEHTKQVRKRKKMHPKATSTKRKSQELNKTNYECAQTCHGNVADVKEELNNSDEINTTQTVDIVSINNRDSDLNAGAILCVKSEEFVQVNTDCDNISFTDLVNEKSLQLEKLDKMKPNVSELYDIEHNNKAVAGPSHVRENNYCNNTLNLSLNSESSVENSPDIKSFYNISKIFDESITEKEGPIGRENCVKIKSENNKSVILTPKIRPPSKKYIVSSLEKYKIPQIRHPQPYYTDFKDVGDKLEIGQMILKLRSKAARDQKPFDSNLGITTIEEWRMLMFMQNNDSEGEVTDPSQLRTLLAGNRQCVLEPIMKAPNGLEVRKWLEMKDLEQSQNDKKCNEKSVNLDELDNSQAIGLDEHAIDNSIGSDSGDKNKSSANESLQVTIQQDGSYLCFGGAPSQTEEQDGPTVEVNFLTVMVLEVHTTIREQFNPDPKEDAIIGAFIKITNDCPQEHFLDKSITEMIVVDELSKPKLFDRCALTAKVNYVNNEIELIENVIKSVRKHNPDIMCGYEIEMNSWGYFIDRAQHLGIEIIQELSRIIEKHRQKRSKSSDSNDFEGRILGRITFNVWRLFRYELALSSYSFENCMYEVLKERVPKYTYAQLSEWWNDESRVLRWIAVEYYLTRINGTVRMLEKLDIINRTSELARLFGLQWWEVLSRGSQFRVESLMLRAARPLNLVALSPTVKQRAAMKAPECLPLIFEPESRFYADPVIVLDFQSLYPSMMIAYNYCFSTCIGRVQNICGESSYEFGAWRLRIPKSKLDALVKSGSVHWSPVGVGFVKSTVRRGVLPALLRRILAARQAVKKSMKMQTDENLKKALHSRQLGLKLIANVTYGYTAANFSGRMPCVEVGDSVVAKGRETLERAIKLVEKHPYWNAKVVYGDTDSMFVLVSGGTRAEAFQIGQEIADAVTADNPSPVALKLEKVYQPCILQTKKRYVGYMYESAEQLEPVFEAKGIETVRRDGCPAGVKLLHRSLCELFETGNMSRIKRIVTDVLNRLVQGTLPIHELFFTREYNGPNGYRPGAAAPPNEIAKRLNSRDPRSGPRTGERVSWLVVSGAIAVPLVKLARTPAEVQREPTLRPHVAYYATRALLPPLNRCLSLLGVNVFKWWNEIGYIREVSLQHNMGGTIGIARYLWRERCALCGARSQHSICAECAGKSQRVAAILAVRVNKATSNVMACNEICASCAGHDYSSECCNTECPNLWKRQTAKQFLSHGQEIVRQLPDCLRCKDCLDF